MKKLILFFAFYSLALPAFAHEGHDLFDGQSFLHYFTSPIHLLAMVAVVAVVWAIIRYRDIKAVKVRNK